MGVAGELLIGGEGLARGYVNRPELTVEKFIAHPYKPGARLYRTGDLARYRPDGNIDYLGQLDFQVKIRGFRIELGEIGVCLARHPAVKRCVVVAREDKSGDKLLAAYFEPHQDSKPSAADVGVYLKKDLPAYMIPAAFVPMQQLSFLPNGKIDRKAFPSVDVSPAGNVERVVPRNETEQRLAGIFSDVLRLKNVGANENFFDLGGHSLLAVRLMTRIEREFGKCLPLASLFSAPTVRDLAKSLMADPAKAWSNLVPISVSPGSPALFLIHGAGGNVLLYHELARALPPGISLYGFQSQGLDQLSGPLESIEDMAAQCVSEL